jgi:hypothetical protein
MTECIIVNWSLGEGGRPTDVFKEIQQKLKPHRIRFEIAPYEKHQRDSCQFILFEDDTPEMNLKVEEARFIVGFNWDWKEPRLSMIKDLNWAMKALCRDIVWVLKKEMTW